MKSVLTFLMGIVCVVYTNFCIYGWGMGYDSVWQMFYN